MGEKDARTRKQGMLFTITSYYDGMHRTTVECAEKQLFATGNIVVRFSESYYDGMWTTLREKTSFHSKNPIFNHPNPKFDRKHYI